MFRILCDPSSGSVCTVWPAGWPDHTHTHHPFKITLPNTDQAHNKNSVNHYEYFQSSAALYSLMMDYIRYETCRRIFNFLSFKLLYNVDFNL